MSSYSEKFKDPRWQKKRLEVMQFDGFKCRNCGDNSSTLHVHHTYYVSGREPWEYPNGTLQTLCHVCHAAHDDQPASWIDEQGHTRWSRWEEAAVMALIEHRQNSPTS